MRANEFVKKHGWDYSKLFGNGWITFDGNCAESSVDRGDVKRLVESWELVEKHNGLINAKDDLDVANRFSMPTVFGTPVNLLKQAIADVESCQ